ncbi:MAG: hypothetical protein AABY08_04115 [Candidatus Thermoplasmatota archaeon]
MGGASLERTFPIGTGDIDVAVALKDYPRVLETLRRHPRVRNVEPLGTKSGSEFRIGTRWVDVEFINPRPFAGNRPPDDFIDYVRRHRSERTDVATFATPEVVWYMRLAIGDWEVYVQKILRDVRAGVPPSLLDKVLDIAKHFDVLEVLRPRVEQARKMIELAARR